jgi:hypothetical protein
MKKLLSLVISMLILSMPVAFAQELHVQNFAGTQNIQGIVKETDTLNVQVLAKIPGDNALTRSQVRVFDANDNSVFVDSCTPHTDGFFLCSVNLQISSPSNYRTYSIRLFDDDGEEFTEKRLTRQVTNDNIAPELITFGAIPSVFGQGGTTISYTARDYAQVPGERTDVCAGIQHVLIYENDTELPSTGQLPGGNCSVTQEVSYTPKMSGTFDLIAVPVDRLGKEGTSMSQEITVDRSVPVIADYEILANPYGFVLNSVEPTGTRANVRVFISDESLDGSSVRADLSKLTGKTTDVNREVSRLYQENGFHVAEWTNLVITSVNPCEFLVNAADNFGNVAQTKKFTCNLVSDTEGPVATGIETGFETSDGKPLLSGNGVMKIVFEEKGGMATNNAFFDFNQFARLKDLRVNSCEDTGDDTWTCFWQPPEINGVRSWR